LNLVISKLIPSRCAAGSRVVCMEHVYADSFKHLDGTCTVFVSRTFESRGQCGVSENTIRLQVGLEQVEDV
jgi:hypothetical protein